MTRPSPTFTSSTIAVPPTGMASCSSNHDGGSRISGRSHVVAVTSARRRASCRRWSEFGPSVPRIARPTSRTWRENEARPSEKPNAEKPGDRDSRFVRWCRPRNGRGQLPAHLHQTGRPQAGGGPIGSYWRGLPCLPRPPVVKAFVRPRERPQRCPSSSSSPACDSRSVSAENVSCARKSGLDSLHRHMQNAGELVVGPTPLAARLPEHEARRLLASSFLPVHLWLLEIKLPAYPGSRGYHPGCARDPRERVLCPSATHFNRRRRLSPNSPYVDEAGGNSRPASNSAQHRRYSG